MMRGDDIHAAVDDLDYQPTMPPVRAPQALPPEPTEAAWTSLAWFERRTIAVPTEQGATRQWLRPDGTVPDDPNLAACLVAYLSAVTLIETALQLRWTPGAAAPSGIGGRSLTRGAMFNRDGRLVCTAAQEIYFPPGRH